MKSIVVVAVLSALGLAPADGVRGTELNVRHVSLRGSPVEVTEGVSEAEVQRLDVWLEKTKTALRSVWAIPGESTRLAVIERPADRNVYGRQIVALDRDGDGYRVVQEGRRLFDVDFAKPVVFRLAGRTIILADIGCEDVWGVLAWEVARPDARELGMMDVAQPAGEEVFTGRIAGLAEVESTPEGLTVTFPGPLVLYPGDSRERSVRTRAVFREEGGRLKLVTPGG